MGCIEKIYSVSALVGGSECNANCSFCSAKDLRKESNKNIPVTYKSAIRLCSSYGGWSLSLTSSGEPTVHPESVTEALKQYKECEDTGSGLSNVNLFTNGILMGDDEFCDKYLPLWKSLGLTAIAISIHDTDEGKQAEVYGIKNYPSFEKIRNNIHKYGLQCRCTLLLRKGAIDNAKNYEKSVKKLESCGIRNITSWCIGNPDNSYNEFSPSFLGRLSIKWWLFNNTKKTHGHIWGGGVYDYNGTLLRLTDYVTKHNPRKNFVRQMVVFQNGDVNYSWIKEGSTCWKL